METSNIAINEVVYEVSRVYGRDRTAVELVKDKLIESSGQPHRVTSEVEARLRTLGIHSNEVG